MQSLQISLSQSRAHTLSCLVQPHRSSACVAHPRQPVIIQSFVVIVNWLDSHKARRSPADSLPRSLGAISRAPRRHHAFTRTVTRSPPLVGTRPHVFRRPRPSRRAPTLVSLTTNIDNRLPRMALQKAQTARAIAPTFPLGPLAAGPNNTPFERSVQPLSTENSSSRRPPDQPASRRRSSLLPLASHASVAPVCPPRSRTAGLDDDTSHYTTTT